eukprot:TRINITY_DN65363_c0_g1_i1.p1 TRINITY_DN65363_c0_g1~~TRINITY_DN65363_c0_g1_i1.p1  ORF type:complete len:244 (+),score=52.62 TRINITY_DN65363_c0_g1_i1:54-785(+)
MAPCLDIILPIVKEDAAVKVVKEARVDLELKEDSLWSSQASLIQLALHDTTTAYLILRMLPPRTWWQLRALSSEWCRLLDDSSGPSFSQPGEEQEQALRQDEMQQRLGLVKFLVEAAGPLRTANNEIDFAGCVYRAVHHGRTGPLRALLRPLASETWARSNFALAVAREALTQAAVAGDVEACQVVLHAYGPESPAAATRKALQRDDALEALKVATEWHEMSPGTICPSDQDAVAQVLQAVKA